MPHFPFFFPQIDLLGSLVHVVKIALWENKVLDVFVYLSKSQTIILSTKQLIVLVDRFLRVIRQGVFLFEPLALSMLKHLSLKKVFPNKCPESIWYPGRN